MISLVLLVLLACKSCWFLLVALVLVVKCSVYCGARGSLKLRAFLWKHLVMLVHSAGTSSVIVCLLLLF